MKRCLVLFSIISIFLLPGCVSPQHRRQDYVDEHPLLSETVATAILAGRISEGMTSDDVKASWGEPGMITTSVTEEGIQEIWSYDTPVGRFTSGMVILTISGGKLISLIN